MVSSYALVASVSTDMRLAKRLGVVEAEERLGILLSLVTTDCLPPHVCAPSDNTLSRALRCCCRSNVQHKGGLSISLGLARIVVNDIADLLALSIDLSGDVPVVAIERWLGSKMVVSKSRRSVATIQYSLKLGRVNPAQNLEHCSSGCHFLGSSLEADE